MSFRPRGRALFGALKVFLLVLGCGFLSVPAVQAQSAVPLYRLSYPPYRYLTPNAEQYNQLVTNGWNPDGNVGYLYRNSNDVPDLVPLVLLFHPLSYDFFYTINAAEKNAAMAGGYMDLGAIGYVFSQPATGRSTLYRAFQPSTGQHLFTGQQAEYDGLGVGWIKEGAAAYLVNVSASRTYVASLRGANETPPVTTNASGTAALILSADETTATLWVSFDNLSSAQVAAHVHGPADPGVPASVLHSLPNGQLDSHVWRLAPVGGLSVQQQVDALKAGRLYINIHSANFPDGEIRGQLFRTPTPPPDTNPGNVPEFPSNADATRFLEQATFGPTKGDKDYLRQIGLNAWVNEQFNTPVSGYADVPLNDADRNAYLTLQMRFFHNAVEEPDQLRQRVLFALSQFLVVSGAGDDIPTRKLHALREYAGTLNRHAFGNYRDLLRAVTLSPTMGTYLDMANNSKANPTTGSQPSENYARELLQLFSVGVFQLNLDGSLQLDTQGRPIATYGNAEVTHFARALTGWTYANSSGTIPTNGKNGVSSSSYGGPMVSFGAAENNHDRAPKTLLDYRGAAFHTSAGGNANKRLPGGQTAGQELDQVIDNVFNHPNVGPFVCTRLIRNLVTSNPSSGYVQRVVARFNDSNGPDPGGTRGDLKAVTRAILLDPEARGDRKTDPLYGHLREPALFVTNLLRGLNVKHTNINPYLTVSTWSRRMGQDVFSAPSVFNFYLPDHQISYGGAALFAPEIQTLNTQTAIERANFVQFLMSVTGGDFVTGSGGGVRLPEWEALAHDPAQLVEALNQLLMHGTMSSSMRTIITNAVTAVPAADRRTRAKTAVYLVASSAQYQVQQ